MEIKMKDLPKISDAEWNVMKVLWNHYPVTSSEIISQLKGSNEWSPKTVHTLISRLVKKEAIEVIKGTNHNQYIPKVSEAEMNRAETKSFVKKIYNGSINLFVSNFFKEEKLTKDEILELKKILDENMKE
jgi:BlaI family penicillinase repressor